MDGTPAWLNCFWKQRQMQSQLGQNPTYLEPQDSDNKSVQVPKISQNNGTEDSSMVATNPCSVHLFKRVFFQLVQAAAQSRPHLVVRCSLNPSLRDESLGLHVLSTFRTAMFVSWQKCQGQLMTHPKQRFFPHLILGSSWGPGRLARNKRQPACRPLDEPSMGLSSFAILVGGLNPSEKY